VTGSRSDPEIATLSATLRSKGVPDVPVHFDTDHVTVAIETYKLHAWQQIPDRRGKPVTIASDSAYSSL
jgi:hypothetical protein